MGFDKQYLHGTYNMYNIYVIVTLRLDLQSRSLSSSLHESRCSQMTSGQIKVIQLFKTKSQLMLRLKECISQRIFEHKGQEAKKKHILQAVVTRHQYTPLHCVPY